MSVTASESGAVSIAGSTTGLVRRSLTALSRLLDPVPGSGGGSSHHRRARPRFSSRRVLCRRKERRVARRQCERMRTCPAGGGRPRRRCRKSRPFVGRVGERASERFKRTHPRTEVRCTRMPRGTASTSTFRTTVAASQPDSPKRCASPSRKVASAPRDIELQLRVESAGSRSGLANLNRSTTPTSFQGGPAFRSERGQSPLWASAAIQRSRRNVSRQSVLAVRLAPV